MARFGIGRVRVIHDWWLGRWRVSSWLSGGRRSCRLASHKRSWETHLLKIRSKMWRCMRGCAYPRISLLHWVDFFVHLSNLRTLALTAVQRAIMCGWRNTVQTQRTRMYFVLQERLGEDLGAGLKSGSGKALLWVLYVECFTFFYCKDRFPGPIIHQQSFGQSSTCWWLGRIFVYHCPPYSAKSNDK